MAYKKKPPKKIGAETHQRNDNPYEELRISIVRQAVNDLEKAMYFDDKAEISECRTFFKSSWGQELTDNHGEDALIRIRKTVLEMKKATRAIKRRNIETNIKATPERLDLFATEHIKSKQSADGTFTFSSYFHFRNAFRVLCIAGLYEGEKE